MAEDQDDVAIIFTYIVDFDTIVMLEKNRVVQMLDTLYR